MLKIKHSLLFFTAIFSLQLAAQQAFTSDQTLWTRAADVSAKMEQYRTNGPTVVTRSGLLDALNNAFDATCASSPIKGINAAIWLPDSTVWKRAHGFATELPFTTNLSTEHLMGMGSITKTFVSATLLTLVDEGLLSLQDTIGKFLPTYPNISGKVTIRQMLSHRSGISDYLNENPAMVTAWIMNPDSIWSTETVLQNYVLAPNFAPGAAWSYSNTNYLLAERIIEELTGKTWYQVLRERILDPMGLTHTFAYPWETPVGQPFSHVWADFDGNGIVDDLQGNGLNMQGLFSLAAGAGGLISTPEDIAKFNQILFSGQLLQASTMSAMMTDYLQTPSTGIRYGLGTMSMTGFQPYANWGHNGNLIYKSFALYFPSLGISIAVQQNDDRLDSPQTPMTDFVDVFVALLFAYLDYQPMTAVNEPSARPELFLSPNPTEGILNVVWQDAPPSEVTYVLVNGLGQVMKTGQFDGQTLQINLSDLPKGVYYLSAQHGSTRYSLPVVRN